MNSKLDFNEIEKIICDFDLKNKSRKRHLVYMRYYFINFIHSYGFGWSFMGRLIGKDHASMMNAVKQHAILSRYEDYLETTSMIAEALKIAIITEVQKHEESCVNEAICLVLNERRYGILQGYIHE